MAYDESVVIAFDEGIAIVSAFKPSGTPVRLQRIMIQVAGGRDTNWPEGAVTINVMSAGKAIATLILPREAIAKLENGLQRVLFSETRNNCAKGIM